MQRVLQNEIEFHHYWAQGQNDSIAGPDEDLKIRGGEGSNLAGITENDLL